MTIILSASNSEHTDTSAAILTPPPPPIQSHNSATPGPHQGFLTSATQTIKDEIVSGFKIPRNVSNLDQNTQQFTILNICMNKTQSKINCTKITTQDQCHNIM
jgi:hypothetical protein